MSSHPFDAFARLLAGSVSRRDVLRTFSALAAATAAHAVTIVPRVAAARRSVQQEPEPAPPGFWPPDFPLDPPGEVIDDYVDCLADGHTPEECDRGFPWCEIKEYWFNKNFPNLSGVIEALNPFGEDCGTAECLQCCYVPANNACHSSYIGENVINCRPGIYGAGTRGVGLTLLLQDPPEEGTCLFTPQVCAHIGMCLQEDASGAATAAGQAAPAQQAAQANYLSDPRAIKQRARDFTSYALTQARHYIDEYATDSPDAPPLQTLNDAILGRGWATWRQDMAALTFDLNDPLFRAVDGAGNLIESVSRANVGRTFALARLLTGLPNLAARLEYVESRVWNATTKAAYLASTADPEQLLNTSLDPHIVAILKRVATLQDYRLLAPALAGEAADQRYGGMPLGVPPTLRLSASATGLAVTLNASLEDATAAAGLARPLSVDWGDGRVTHHELPSGQATLAVSHTFAAADRYAIYAVAANNSGLRGAACTVVEVQGAGGSGQPARITQAAMPTVVRAGLPGLVISNLPFTRDLRLALYFDSATGSSFRAGRSRIASGPTNITVPVPIGDAYAHNPSRIEVNRLRIEPRHGIVGPSIGRIASLTLSTLLLGVFSTARMEVLDQPITLTAGMLKVFLEGSTTPMAAGFVTVDGAGSLNVPLLYRASSSAPWQRVERIEIDITEDIFDAFATNAASTTLPAGTSAAWVELRPGNFTKAAKLPAAPPSPGSTRVFVPSAQR